MHSLETTPTSHTSSRGALSADLRSIGITVKQAESDGDVLIISTALDMFESDNERPVVVVGTDNDLLAMLIVWKCSSQ